MAVSGETVVSPSLAQSEYVVNHTHSVLGLANYVMDRALLPRIEELNETETNTPEPTS